MNIQERDERVEKLIKELHQLFTEGATGNDGAEFRARVLSVMGGMAITPSDNLGGTEPFAICLSHFLAAGELMRNNISKIDGTAQDLVSAALQFFIYMCARCVKDDAHSVNHFADGVNFMLREGIFDMKKMMGTPATDYNPPVN